MLELVYQIVALSCPVGTVLWVGWAAWTTHRRSAGAVPDDEAPDWAEAARRDAGVSLRAARPVGQMPRSGPAPHPVPPQPVPHGVTVTG